jgi:hypothetical protein
MSSSTALPIPWKGSAVVSPKAWLRGELRPNREAGMPLRSLLLEKVDRETDVRGRKLQAKFIHPTKDVAKCCNNLRDVISVEITSIRTISHPRYFLCDRYIGLRSKNPSNRYTDRLVEGST